MKNCFIILLSIVSFSALGQTQQNINKNTGTVSNVLTTIDSIRFNSSSTTMEVVLQNGTVESHSISDIQNVNFISASQHSCGAANVHNPNLNYGSMTDQEGNVYKTIVIGTQEWMAENLKTSIYRNGDLIPNITNAAEWSGLSTGAWVFYNNDSLYECPYGRLYNWYSVSDSRHVCPSGWHEPTEIEWTILTNFLGGESVAGGKLKATLIGPSENYGMWYEPNLSATNESGFSGLPGGFRTFDNAFEYIGDFGAWWGGAIDIYSSIFHNLSYGSGSFSTFQEFKYVGYSVRCLKD